MQAVLTKNSQIREFATRAQEARQIKPGKVVLANITNATALPYAAPELTELRLCWADMQFLRNLGTCKHRDSPPENLQGTISGIDLERIGNVVDLMNVKVSWDGTFKIESTPETRVVVY